MDYMPAIRGYHANSTESCGRFLSGEFNRSPDKTWLGKGVYFWDNITNAKYWLSEKVRKRELQCIEDGMIVQAFINCENLLDLTDREVLETLSNIWLMLCRLDSTARKSQIDDKGIGYRIDYVINRFPNEYDFYCVIRGFGHYKKKKSDRSSFLEHHNSYLVDDIRMVYSVRKVEAILERREFKEEK